MKRPASLNLWLAIALGLALVVPGSVGVVSWVVVGARQDARVDARASAAARAVAEGTNDATTSMSPELARRLHALGVEAEIEPPKPILADPMAAKLAMVQGVTPIRTAGLELLATQADGKHELGDRFVARTFHAGQARGTLYIEKPNRATRTAVAIGAALVALIALLALSFTLLRRWVIRPLERMAGDAAAIAGGTLDVTPVRSAAREVDDVGAALVGMARGLGEALSARVAAEEQRAFLVAALAHDLRTPLFTLRGSLEALEHGIGEGDQLLRAQQKAASLDRLVGDLFAYSRTSYVRPVAAPLDAAALAREAARLVDAPIAVLAPDARIDIVGDHTALLRVLLNLLDNAARHAHNNVELAVVPEADGVSFTVSDDGDGIAETDLPHIFEPLFRADRARGAHSGGAGLGLAIVERLCAATGAAVRASNRRGGGASFTVHVPHVGGSPC